MATGLLPLGRVGRSFVRSWATVATLLALVTFAFVEPMPEAPARTHAAPAVGAISADAISAEVPLVDSMASSKTFTPLALPAPAAGPEVPRIGALASRPGPTSPVQRPPDPLIRPG